MADRIYDGHVNLVGVDCDTDPCVLSNNLSAKAINRIFRGGRNRTRNPFRHYPFMFYDENDEIPFKFGNFQGWMPYSKKAPGGEDGAVVSVAGTIYFLTVVGECILVRKIFGGNNPKLLHAWFVQAENWVYIQNGQDRPIFWDGSFPSSARYGNADTGEMPIGTIMAYIHGRVAVTNAYNQIEVGDIIFGSGITSTSNTQRFTETTYWAEGGYFSQSANLGPITGAAVAPRQNTNNTGQGELVILSRDGASAFDLSVPRLQWKDVKIQAVTLAGRGCTAHASVILVNNDIWFRSVDGISSYRESISDQNKSSFSKISRDVNNWLSADTKWLQEHCAMLYFNNRVFCTTYPKTARPRNSSYGMHVFHNGMVVLDLDPASAVQGDSSFNWDGLWTGIRPQGLLKNGSKAFAFSFDPDGENRIYEIEATGKEDFVNETYVDIRSMYITKKYAWEQTQKSNRFASKQLLGGEIFTSNVTKRSEVSVFYRPDYMPVWIEFLPVTQVGADYGSEYKFTNPLFQKIQLPTPQKMCGSGLRAPTNHGMLFQFAIVCCGQYTIDAARFAAAFPNDTTSQVGQCGDFPENFNIDGALENDFAYNAFEYRQYII